MDDMQALSYPTLSDAVFPASGWRTHLAKSLVMSAVIAIGAQLEVVLAFTPVPLTGQTFGVLLAGVLLGSRWGAFSAGLYLVEGAVGLPVFAGGGAGPLVFAGPTAGYLVGFMPAAWVAGRLAERGWDRSPATAAAAMLAGSAAIFACGLLNLARFLPLSGLLSAGLWPFLPGDLIKAGLAAAALPVAWRLLGRR